jgi:poly-beta-1,6-N-acetyl-D-glucosamine synthase
MISQKTLPKEWIIVDDGSMDNTGELVEKHAARHSWIKVVHRRNRGFRKPGGGVIEAFNDGYSSIGTTSWDFIVKLDGDLCFDQYYFEKCFERFAQDPDLGIGGGGLRL